MPIALLHVRFQGQSGKHALALMFSAFDPEPTLDVDARHKTEHDESVFVRVGKRLSVGQLLSIPAG